MNHLYRRLGAFELAVAAVAVGVGVGGVGVAAADPTPEPVRPPNCAAADLAGIAAGVAAATSAYLYTHPDVDGFFTGLHGLPNEEAPDAIRDFFDAHPQEHAELKGIRQPLKDFRTRCGYEDVNRLGEQ
ncbi:heme-binding protein [Mycolicibacterium brumae]|uniref:Hemophore-related protein n=1 Tax=Mycolicibacterium brumae TaxID=85968 RepID=A0A2G5P887_9MYCO|nr:heme-binding protein [Mycolicibacterium brumae]MCV7194663.1 heme-binding protein [Mycolicibacterium brumae]PIB74104.1 hemophore-related protein [Mycolicibacterium brumae]RWA19143.1 hypothetical protein MBRU_17305 [Mycolicibacterium brumae DSM 44177]UWW08411.1 heme-binding protein [Mycolicibacterium brumae]